MNTQGILNVLLHGAYTFVRKKDDAQILALAPLMQHHVYRAGSWLAETALRGRDDFGEATAVFELSGVEPTDGRIDIPPGNLIVKYDELPAKPAPFVVLKLPEPRQITSLRVADISSESFSHEKKLAVAGETQHMATLQVFTYDIADENALRLHSRHGGHYWEPAFTGDYINLHVFAAEDHFHRFSSAQEDINRCLALLGVEVRLNTQFLPAGEIPDPTHLPAGVTPEETEDLALRTRRMARLGRLVTQNGDANLAWHGNDALDGDQHACGGAWGDNGD